MIYSRMFQMARPSVDPPMVSGAWEGRATPPTSLNATHQGKNCPSPALHLARRILHASTLDLDALKLSPRAPDSFLFKADENCYPHSDDWFVYYTTVSTAEVIIYLTRLSCEIIWKWLCTKYSWLIWSKCSDFIWKGRTPQLERFLLQRTLCLRHQ